MSMKKIMNLVLAATLICGATLFIACTNEDNPVNPVDNLSEKIIGKWITADIDGQPMPTNEMWVISILSPNKAFISASLFERPEIGSFWFEKEDVDISISGNKMTITITPDEYTTMVEEYDITSINDTEMRANLKIITSVDDKPSLSTSMAIRFTKFPANSSTAIIGTWEGRCTSENSVFDDGQEHRWQYNADGTYVYYVKDGDNWVPSENTLNEYFVDGTLLCTRWVDNEQENREWWEISIDGDKMNWTALRQKEDGSTFTATFEMTKVVE